jgi:hypothetical protein
MLDVQLLLLLLASLPLTQVEQDRLETAHCKLFLSVQQVVVIVAVARSSISSSVCKGL